MDTTHPPPASFGPIAATVMRRAIRAALLGVVLGVFLHGVFGGDFLRGAVHTVCITMASWLFVDGGRALAARWFQREREAALRGWPGWGWMGVVIVVGTFGGFYGGSAVAGWMLGVSTPGLLVISPEKVVPSLIISAFIGIATTYFLWSRSRIAATEAQAQKAQRESAEHQLRLLQSQLEPHMLFNTLANLRVLIGSDPPRAQAMLDALIDFLRATLAASRTTLHPLEAEFARCADYLALMRVRMGPRLATALVLPPELAAVQVPALLLQPLVENAIKHGLEPKVDGGHIVLDASRDGAQLVLTVRDGGLGIAATPVTPGGFGLTQVRERLATLYGAKASLVLERGAEGGTVATVRLPIA